MLASEGHDRVDAPWTEHRGASGGTRGAPLEDIDGSVRTELLDEQAPCGRGIPRGACAALIGAEQRGDDQPREPGCEVRIAQRRHHFGGAVGEREQRLRDGLDRTERPLDGALAERVALALRRVLDLERRERLSSCRRLAPSPPSDAATR